MREESPSAPSEPGAGSPVSPVWLGIATAGGLGHAPVAPGTFGAAAGVALHLVLAMAGAGPLVFGALAGAVLVLGARASTLAEQHFGKHDDGRIVVDEVAGQLIALFPLIVLAPDRLLDPAALALGFAAFRLFDIWKPGPVRAAERRFEAGWGVMLDDVVAGLLAAALLSVALLTGVLP